MNKRYCIALLSATVLALAFFVVRSSRAAADISVEGKIEDRLGKDLDGINIVAIRSGEQIAEARSGPQGGYRLKLASGRPFDLVFDKPEYQTAVLTSLSGKNNHAISKVMLREGESIDRRTELAADFARKYVNSLRD